MSSGKNPFKPKIKCLRLFTTAEKQSNSKNVKLKFPFDFTAFDLMFRKYIKVFAVNPSEPF
jgi:hypothetical protein